MPQQCDTHSLPAAALIVGCGDIGQRVAAGLMAAGVAVSGVVRSPSSAQAVTALGATPLMLDLDAGASLPSMPLLFWFAPPPDRGDVDSRLRAALARFDAPPRRIVYISTSGVYGDCEGRWIDETEPLKPQTPRGRRRLDAEQALAEYAKQQAVEIVVLRVPGIYGPGRLPLARLRQGLPVVRADQSPCTNRIHADDLAGVAIAAASRGQAGSAYNVSDGNPTTMSDYFGRCARLLGLPPPPEVSMAEARAQLTPAMLSFLEESKRLLTAKMRKELAFEPRYPNLETGLPSCLDPVTPHQGAAA